MSRKKVFRYTMFALLYFTQGTILGYFTALNALYLLDHGLEMSEIGAMGIIVMIPFVIKMFFAVLSDRVNLFGMGYRKPYLLIGLAIQTISVLCVPLIDPKANYGLFVFTAFMLQFGMALYDTCTDGYALDITPEDEEGTIQSFMVGGRALATVITAAVAGVIVERFGWPVIFYVLGALTLLPIPFVLAIKEEERKSSEDFDWKAFSALRRPEILALACLGCIYSGVIVGANQNVNPFLENTFGISLDFAGFYTAIWGVGVVLGSALSGVLLKLTSRKYAAQICLVIQLLAILHLAITPDASLAWGIIPFFGIAYGASTAMYFSLAMGVVDSRIAASMYSILMAVTNLAQGVGMAVMGVGADTLGYRWSFVAIASVSLLGFLLVPVIFRKSKVEVVSAT